MNIKLKSEKNNTFAEGNNEERNDSMFQQEGDYIINKFPKYKYEIKVMHASPNRILKKTKTPERITPSARFTIISNEKLNQANKENIYLYNNRKIINNLYNNGSPRTGPTIRFYSKNYNEQREIRNNTYEKTFKNLKKYKKYNNRKYQNYNYIKNYNTKYNNYDYIIEIYPQNPCICQREINKIINKYFDHNKIMLNNYKYNSNIDRSCDRIYKRNINIYNSNMKKDNNNYHSLYNSPKKRIFNQQFLKNNPIKNINYPSNENSLNNFKKISNNYYYDSNLNYFNKNIINKKKITEKYNNNIYLVTSNKSSIKKSKKLKKIKISKKNINHISNNSFISADNSKNKNINTNNNSFINQKKYIRKNYYLSPNYIKSQNISNNLNSTNRSNGRKSNNIMINKSSERQEKVKIVPLGQKIQPLLVKKSVEKPVKEKIINKDGTTSNVIRQTSVITSIESKPIINNNNLSNDKKLVKEYITKIYTTLTKNENDIDENNNNDNDNNDIANDIANDNANGNINLNNNIKEEKMNKLLKDIKITNENEENENKNDKENNLNIDNYNQQINNINININDNYKKNYYNNNDNDSNKKNMNNNIENLEINNDLLIYKNNNSSFNCSSIHSNMYDPNGQNNIARINDIVKYIKYLYYRYTNLISYEDAKEESLFNYFLKLNDEEKNAVLQNLNDGNIENKKIYNKLISILNDNYDKLISDEDKESNNKKKQTNILFKKKIIK